VRGYIIWLLTTLVGCSSSRYPALLSTPNNWRVADAEKATGDEQHDIDACKRDANLYPASPYSTNKSGRTESFADCMQSKGYKYVPPP